MSLIISHGLKLHLIFKVCLPLHEWLCKLSSNQYASHQVSLQLCLFCYLSNEIWSQIFYFLFPVLFVFVLFCLCIIFCLFGFIFLFQPGHFWGSYAFSNNLDCYLFKHINHILHFALSFLSVVSFPWSLVSLYILQLCYVIVLILFGLFSVGIIKSLAWKYKNPERFCISFCKILGDTTNSEFILSLFLAYFSLHHENSMNWGSTSTLASSHDHEFSKEGFVPSIWSRRRQMSFFLWSLCFCFCFLIYSLL